MKPTRVLAGFASVALLVFSLVVLLPDYAYACSCGGGGPESPQERAERLLEESPAVFSGEVQDIEGDMENEGFQTVTLRTIDVWKGPHRDTLEVTTGGMCAYIFEEGREYLLYADQGDQGLNVDVCGYNKPLSEASEEVQALNLVDTSGGVPDLRVVGLAGLAAMIAGLLLLRLLLRRSLNI